MHAVLRLCGGRGRLLASLAATLYSGGVALLAIAVLYLCAASAFPSLRPAGDVSRADVNAFAAALITFAVCFAVFLVLLVAGLARTLRVSARLSTIAVAAALVASALVFGALRPPGSSGLHPVVWINRDGAGHWRGRFELSLS